MGQFSSTATFPCTPEALRSYLGNPANLPNITDPELNLQVLEAPDTVAEGEEIEFSIHAWGFPQRIRHRWVTVTDQQIIVEQVEGPTESWRHEQTITAAPEGCLLTETISFEPPGGMLGYILTEDAIRQSLESGTAIRIELLTRQLA